MLAFGKPATNSLYGLENSVPPRPSVSIKTSLSDLNKPLPLTPSDEDCDTSSSSLYSADINEFIDLYLGGPPSSKAPLESAGLSLPGYCQYTQSDTFKIYNAGKFSVSESVLCSTTNTGQIPPLDSNETDEVTIKYRYSNPEGCSPILPESITRDCLYIDDIRTTDAAKKYRDTLLPTPFTPISVRSPDIFPDIVPLRGPRFKVSPSSGSVLQGQEIDQLPMTNFKDASERESLRWSTHHSNEQTSQVSEPRIYSGKFPWSQHSTVYSEISNPYQSSLPYENLTTLVHPNTQAPKSPRPAPSPYFIVQQSTCNPYPIRSSSISNHDSQSNTSSFLLPRNWSPYLKPSNPAIPRVPRSERSPAIGLSAYQMLGSKAWEIDEQEGRKQSRNPLFNGKMKVSKHFTSKLKSLDLGGRSMPQVQDRSHSSQPNLDTQTNIPDTFLSYSHSMRSISPGFPSSQNLHAYSELAHTEESIDFSVSSIQTPQSELELSTRSTGQSSKESSKNVSWLKTQKRKFIGDKHDAWKKGIKDKITVVPAHHGIGPFQGISSSGVASEAQYPIPEIVQEPAPKLSGPIRSNYTSLVVSPDGSWI